MQLAVEISANNNKKGSRQLFMRNKLKILVLAIGYLFGILVPAVAQEETTKPFDSYKVKAVFLYNFTKFVKWPGQTSLAVTHNANVCIYGDNPFNGKLDILEKASSPELTFHIKRNVSQNDFPDCQILFVSKSQAANMSEVIAGTHKLPVLTASDIDGFAASGGVVEMRKSENNIGKESIKLIINLESAEAKNLDIDAQLLAIAAEVIK
jgi:hypothetical protein